MTRKVIGIVLMLFCAGMVWGQTLTKAQEQQFLYYYYEANRLILLQETEKARPIVEFCYLLNPNDANINNYLGYYAKEDGNIPEMIAYFKKAYELAPSDYWYNYNVLLLQTEIKDKQLEAINNLKAVAKANKRDEDVHAVLQKAYISLNLLPEALKVQDALDSIHGYNEQSAIQRYRLNTMMGKNKQAILEIERYLKEEPENYQFHVFRLQLYEQTQQPADKLIKASKAMGIKDIAIAGGVSANSELRRQMQAACDKEGFALYMPPLSLCGDNAAMIASEGLVQFKLGNFADMSLTAKASIPLAATLETVQSRAAEKAGK